MKGAFWILLCTVLKHTTFTSLFLTLALLPPLFPLLFPLSFDMKALGLKAFMQLHHKHLFRCVTTPLMSYTLNNEILPELLHLQG